jgi:hypothetical protein
MTTCAGRQRISVVCEAYGQKRMLSVVGIRAREGQKTTRGERQRRAYAIAVRLSRPDGFEAASHTGFPLKASAFPFATTIHKSPIGWLSARWMVDNCVGVGCEAQGSCPHQTGRKSASQGLERPRRGVIGDKKGLVKRRERGQG